MKLKVGDYVRVKMIVPRDYNNYKYCIGHVGKIYSKSSSIKNETMIYYIRFLIPIKDRREVGCYEEELVKLTKMETFMEIL